MYEIYKSLRYIVNMHIYTCSFLFQIANYSCCSFMKLVFAYGCIDIKLFLACKIDEFQIYLKMTQNLSVNNFPMINYILFKEIVLSQYMRSRSSNFPSNHKFTMLTQTFYYIFCSFEINKKKKTIQEFWHQIIFLKSFFCIVKS